MPSSVKISVIVPTYNRGRTLCNTLELLLTQDYGNYETIVVDQSETHDLYTAKYFERNQGKICRLRFRPPNLPAARNFGIGHSTGEIVLFCDDDLLLPSNALSTLAEAYGKSAVWGATGFVVSPDMTSEEKLASHAKSRKARRLLARGEPLIRVRECIGCFMSFRRALFDRIGYFDEWLGTQPMGAGEDAEFATRMNARGYSLFLLTNLTVTHLGANRGGCERRTLPANFVTKAQLRAIAYCYLKNRRYPSWLGWADALWRCQRSLVLNRQVFSAGLGALVSRERLCLSTVPEMFAAARRSLASELASASSRQNRTADSPVYGEKISDQRSAG